MTKKVIISRAKLAHRIAKGWTIQQCASYFGVSGVTIRNRLKSLDIPAPKPKNFNSEVLSLYGEGYSRSEIAEKLGISLGQVRTAMRHLGINYTSEQRAHIQGRKLKESYRLGRIKPIHFKHYPDEAREKISQWNKQHWHELANKREETCLKKYGSTNAFSSDIIKERIRKTNLSKYGSASPMKNPEIRAKASNALKETLAKKYGHENRVRLIKNRYGELGRKLTPTEMETLWGVSQSNAYKFMREYGLENYVTLGKHRLEQEISRFLDENRIEYERNNRSLITNEKGNKAELDFYIPEYNLAIEANDVWTHNSSFNAYGGKPKDKKYHLQKSQECEKKGIRLIHIWDYEWHNLRQKEILKSIILGACNQAKTIYARKCTIEIRESKTMREFFDKNNLAGFRGGKFAVCLVYEGEIVMAYMMGHAFFGKGKYEWEVIRGATKLGYRVIGGASRIWKYFIKTYNPSSIVYYVDYNYFNGNSVEKLGAKFVKSQIGCKNYFVNQGRVRNRQPFKNSEIKELIKKHRVYTIWTAGTKVYVWENSNRLA